MEGRGRITFERPSDRAPSMDSLGVVFNSKERVPPWTYRHQPCVFDLAPNHLVVCVFCMSPGWLAGQTDYSMRSHETNNSSSPSPVQKPYRVSGGPSDGKMWRSIYLPGLTMFLPLGRRWNVHYLHRPVRRDQAAALRMICHRRGNGTILVQPSGAVGIYTSRHLHLAKRCLTFQLNHVIDLRPLACTVILWCGDVLWLVARRKEKCNMPLYHLFNQ